MDQTLLRQNATNVLESALASEYGIRVCIHTSGLVTPATRGRQQLYRFKNENDRFKTLKIDLDKDDPNNRLFVLRADKIATLLGYTPATRKNPISEMEALDIDL